MLSTADWMKDSVFDDEDFFKSIMALFSDGEDPWVVETLAWWQKYAAFTFLSLALTIISQIFGANDVSSTTSSSDAPPKNAAAAILAKRALRAQNTRPTPP